MNPARRLPVPPVWIVAILVIAATGVAARASRPAGGASPNGPTLVWVDSLVRAEALDRGVPGVAVAIVSGGHVLLQRGYGVADLETGRAVNAATPFNIASLTKPFTSAAAALVANEGLVDLQGTIGAYLPGLPTRYSDITVRQLLTHTSGVDRDLRGDNLDDPSAEEYRSRVDTASIHASPGERWEYSNTGYTILGWVLAAATQRSLAEVFKERIFDPLGMRQARYRVSFADDPERARPYDAGGATAHQAPYVTGGLGSGGLSMSIADLARFAVALQTDELLTPAQKARAWEPTVLSDGTTVSFDMMASDASYGLGWFLTRYEERRLMTHGGGISGYSSNLYHFVDEGLTIVVLANVKGRDDGAAPVDPLARAIASTCFARSACEPSANADLSTTSLELDAANRAFSEAYVAGDTERLRRAYTDGALVLPPRGQVVVGAHGSGDYFAPGNRTGHLAHVLYPEWRTIDGGTAHEMGTWYDVWLRAGDTITSSGRYLLGWQREASTWRISADAWQASGR